MGSPVIWTAATAIAALRDSIGDPSGADTGRWGADVLDSYFNRAQLQFATDVPRAFETVWKDDLVQDKREYALPDGFLYVDHVRYIATDRTDVRLLEGVSMEEYKRWVMRDEDNTGPPWIYYLWRKLGQDAINSQQPLSIYLHPTPGADEVGTDNLEVWGHKLPDSIDSSTNPTYTVEVEPQHIEAVLSYASYVAMMDDEDMARADRFMSRYREEVEKAIAVTSRRDRGDFDQILPKGARRLRWQSKYGRGLPIRW